MHRSEPKLQLDRSVRQLQSLHASVSWVEPLLVPTSATIIHRANCPLAESRFSTRSALEPLIDTSGWIWKTLADAEETALIHATAEPRRRQPQCKRSPWRWLRSGQHPTANQHRLPAAPKAVSARIRCRRNMRPRPSSHPDQPRPWGGEDQERRGRGGRRTE